MSFTIHEGDCLDVLATLEPCSIDSIVTDPPYAEIDRSYGRLTEPEWLELMDSVVAQARRVLKPTGSAVFILQPSSKRVGSMRTCLWEFIAKWSREWNQVQDVIWFNVAALPTSGCRESIGLMRPSVKYCVWLGPADCYRNQGEVLMEPSESMKALMENDSVSNDLKKPPGGQSVRPRRIANTVIRRGGVTPFNCLAIPNTVSTDHSGHGAATPYALASWWVRYLTPPRGLTLDPFAGSGTMALAANRGGFDSIGIERDPNYAAIARRRVEEDAPLFNRGTG